MLHRPVEAAAHCRLNKFSGKDHNATSALLTSDANFRQADIENSRKRTVTSHQLFVRHTMRHMPGGDMLACGFTMFLLVVKENVRTECLQEFPFVHTAEE